MAGKRSVLLWLLLLPFRPVLRWFTLLLIGVLALGWWTGHLGLGARYLWWRYWPMGPPLVEYLDPASSGFVLVDATRPGAARLAPLVESGKLRARIDGLAQALDVHPRRDVLQLLIAGGSQAAQSLVVARGRFEPASVAAALAQRGYQARPLGQHSLLVHGETGEAVLVHGRSVLLHGAPAAIEAALARAQGEAEGLDDQPRFVHWNSRIGPRHGVLAFSLLSTRQRSLTQMGAGGGQLEALALTLDTDGEQGVQLAICLGPTSPDQVPALQQRSTRIGKVIQSSSALGLPDHLQRLAGSLVVSAENEAVWLRGQSSAADLALLVRDVEHPEALASTAVGVVTSLAAGSLLDSLGLGGARPGSAPGQAPGTAPGSPPGVAPGPSSAPAGGLPDVAANVAREVVKGILEGISAAAGQRPAPATQPASPDK